ncbi:phosphoribosylformylglycinamidine cyclo-ligase [bacterium]|nr:phosphoribosylformylglycinamidine cyclo-ligase [bacterium]
MDKYKAAGVDLNEAESITRAIARAVGQSGGTALSKIGDFGGAFELDLSLCQEPVLISSADGVGTKIDIAIAAGIHDTVGRDLVNHCVNDIMVCGANPLFFLDYIAYSKADPAVIGAVVGGIAAGCKEIGIPLLGGETAQMPGYYPRNKYDLVGFIVGVVDKSRYLTGKTIREGNQLIGLASSGLHTNGYSLARKILFKDHDLNVHQVLPEYQKTIAESLLAIHKCYLKATRILYENGIEIRGMAHITGGGIPGNLNRILPDNIDAVVNIQSWPVLPIFETLRKLGEVPREEIYRVFNMGIGFIYVIRQEQLEKALRVLNEAGEESYHIGFTTEGTGQVLLK